MTDFNTEHNRIVWCDIPVVDLDRAIHFYSQMLNADIEKTQYEDLQFAVCDHDQGNGFCLIPLPEMITLGGPLIYLNVHGRISEAVQVATDLGAEIIEPITPIGEYGQRAIIQDCEGNRIGLHCSKPAT